MVKLLSLICATVLAFGNAAHTAETPLGCYVNTYDKQHLAKHKGQSVTSMTLKLYKITPEPDTTAAPMNAFVSVKLRNSQKTWTEDGSCFETAGEWRCSIDCDGGNFRLSIGENGVTLFNPDGFRVSQDGCGENNDAVEAKPGNRMFRLAKAKLSACK